MELVVAIISLIYGVLGLSGSKHFSRFLRDIEETRKRLYSRLCGLSLLMAAMVVGAEYYLQKRNLLDFSAAIILLVLLLIPLALSWTAHEKFKKRRSK